MAKSESNRLHSTEGISAYFVLFTTLLALVLVFSKLLHASPTLRAFIPEAGMILLVGIVAGFFISLFDENEILQSDDDDDSSSIAQSLLSFSPQVFFVALLPPIIFNSGYHLRRELFFRHLIPIALFAVIGTLVSAFSITFFMELVKSFGWTGNFTPRFTELLAFGALISATDPVSTLAVFQAKRVDPHLFYLVFGESVLNDAVGLVLFETFRKFVVKDNGAEKVVVGISEFMIGFLIDSIGSPVLGLVCGCGAALLFKHVDMRNTRLLELSVYVLIMYVPFLLAQSVKLSGIVTILFTGMTARAYVVPNLSTATSENAEILFRLFAHLAETSIFLELGLSVSGLRGNVNGLFILWALLACLVGRALNVYPITFLYNLRLQTKPKDESEMDAEMSRKNTQYRRKTGNNSHVEMMDSLPKTDPLCLDGGIEDRLTPPAVSRQSSSITAASVQSRTPKVRRDLKIHWKTAHMLCFSGLRGAVAYACVRSFPDTFGRQTEFVVTVMSIVLVSVFTLGGATEAMLSFLDIPVDIDESTYMDNWHEKRQSSNLLLRAEDIIYRNVVRQEQGIHNGETKVERRSEQSDYQASLQCNSHEDREPKSSLHATEASAWSSAPRRSSSLFDFGRE